MVADHLDQIFLKYGPVQGLDIITDELKGQRSQIRSHARTKRKKECELYEACLRFSATLAYLEGKGLVKDLAAYIAQHWTGKQMTITQWRRFLRIVKRLSPEAAALGHQLKGGRSMSLLSDLAGPVDEASRALLEEYLFNPRYSAEAIRRGIKAAGQCAGLDEAERLEAVQAAVHGKRVRRRHGPPSLADDLEKITRAATGLVRVVKSAVAAGGARARHARSFLPLIEEAAAGPSAPADEAEEADREQRKYPRDQEKTANPGPAEQTGALQPAPAPRVGYKEAALAVPYPADDPHCTPSDHHAAAALCAFTRFIHLQPDILDKRLRGQIWDDELIRLAARTLGDLQLFLKQAAPRLRALSDDGHAELSAALANCAPGTTLEDILPLPLARLLGQQPFVPLAYLKLDLRDPTGEGTTAHSGLERDLIAAMALCAQGHHHFTALLQHLDQNEEVAPDLIFQLDQVLAQARGRLLQVVSRLHGDIKKTQQAYEARRAEREARRLAAEARLIVAGAETVPPQYSLFALTSDARPLALTQTTPQSILVAGEPGSGKTQAGITLAEGALLNPPGLGRMHRPSRVIVLTSNLGKAEGNHQHLYGVHPNPYPEQWDYLRHWYQIEFGPAFAGHRRILCLVLPGTKEWYEQRYPDLVERGVEFRELRFHPDEQGSLFYRVMVQGGETSGTGR
ncbi:MAG TPA: hypothetical protein VKY15_01080, partial [Acidimicrobiales bacterium]|nr:hypothetical protein [Acidimicrobiales bacterium]